MEWWWWLVRGWGFYQVGFGGGEEWDWQPSLTLGHRRQFKLKKAFQKYIWQDFLTIKIPKETEELLISHDLWFLHLLNWDKNTYLEGIYNGGI